MSRILVVRTEPAAGETVAALGTYGHEAAALPLLRIRPSTLSAQDKVLLGGWRDFQVVIVVSAHAARGFVAEVGGVVVSGGTEWLSIGMASAAPLTDAGVRCQIPDQPAGSEALLEMPALGEHQIKGRKVLILQGEHARDLLAQTLRSRGAEVTRVALYAREPNLLPSDVIATVLAKPWSLGLIGSGELLLALVKYRTLIGATWPLLVPSPRVAELAAANGFAEVSVLANLDAQSVHLWLLRQSSPAGD